jgi:adenylate kinase
MLNIVLFGPPGAGKGTVAQLLVEEKGWKHLSTGSLLRDEVERGTPVGQEAAKLIERGFLVPDQVVIDMVRKYVSENMPCKGFIFDGYPRTTEQAAQLDVIMAAHGAKIDAMVALAVTETEIIRRLQNRASIEGRTDDADIAIIHNRLETYHEKTKITSDYYAAQGKFHTVDSGKTPEYTLAQIMQIFEAIAQEKRD